VFCPAYDQALTVGSHVFIMVIEVATNSTAGVAGVFGLANEQVTVTVSEV